MKVKTNVYVMKDGYAVLLRAGDDVPEGVTITNPEVVDSPVGVQADKPAADEQADKPAENDTAQKRPSRKAADAS